MRRETAVAGDGRVRVTKSIALGGGRLDPSLTVDVEVENIGETPIDARLGIEWTTTMLGGGGNPAAWWEVAGERGGHDGSGTAEAVTTLAQGNSFIGIAIETTVSEPATAWWAPVETISNSEGGVERAYQGSGLLLSWPLALEPGGSLVRVGRERRDRRPRSRGGGVSRPRLVVHGHFYQPSRLDPATGTVPPDPTAAPARDWNTRIAADCYRPNAELGNYGRISWDLGPTLAGWLEDGDPVAYRGFVDGDGGHHGMAQPFHHTILPLATLADRRTEIRWGLRDFEWRFGRRPTGVWLPGDRGRPRDARAARRRGRRPTRSSPRGSSPVRGWTRGGRTGSTSGGGRIDRRGRLRRGAVDLGLVRDRGDQRRRSVRARADRAAAGRADGGRRPARRSR